MSIKLMQLYLRQQDTVNKMVKKGSCPTPSINGRNALPCVP